MLFASDDHSAVCHDSGVTFEILATRFVSRQLVDWSVAGFKAGWDSTSPVAERS